MAESGKVGRRGLLLAGGGLAVGAGAGWAAHSPTTESAPTKAAAPKVEAVAPHGDIQAGIHTPAVPQSLVQVLVFRREAAADPQQLWGELGETIAELTSGDTSVGDCGDLTVTVGVGLADAARVHSAYTWPEGLPQFARERLGEAHGGDLMLQVCASQPDVPTLAASHLVGALAGKATLIWGQAGSGGEQNSLGEFRNLVGFYDGIMAPRTNALRNAGVWIQPPGEGSLGGAAYVVIRRLRFDVEAWRRLSSDEQEAAIGRTRKSGAPLSGGDRDDQIDLGAKHPDGQWMVPAGAHARRAHPAFIGRQLMLRRSYGFTNGADAGGTDQGVLFIAYLNQVDTFTRTQLRLDEQDDLLAHATCTGSGVFVVLPGFTTQRRLGAGLGT